MIAKEKSSDLIRELILYFLVVLSLILQIVNSEYLSFILILLMCQVGFLVARVLVKKERDEKLFYSDNTKDNKRYRLSKSIGVIGALFILVCIFIPIQKTLTDIILVFLTLLEAVILVPVRVKYYKSNI